MGDIILLTKPVTLTEGDRVTLTTDVLMATDGTGKPEKLLYAVSVPPVPGQIESINYPGCPIPCTASQMDWPRRLCVLKRRKYLSKDKKPDETFRKTLHGLDCDEEKGGKEPST
ncbi:hypothetical protein AB1E18_002037 [Capra hircus]